MPRTLLGLLLAGLLCAAHAAAQDGPPTDHAPRGSEPAPVTSAAPEKGPNLQTPPWLGGAARVQLEAAVKLWDEAYALYTTKGGDAAKAKVEEAIEALKQARTAEARCAIPDHYLGIAYQLTGEYQQAIDRLRDAVRKNPAFHEAMVELGDAFRWAKRDPDAEKAYDDAIKTRPDYAHAYHMRALLRVAKERFEPAREDIRKARELKPADPTYLAIDKQLSMLLDGPPWPKKFEAESKNYIIRTNVSQEYADDISKHAELIRRLYETIFPKPPKARRKSPIIVFASKQEYHQNGGPQGAGGHFDPAFKQLFLFRYEKDSDTKLVLYHEGFHQFLDQLEVDAPQWFNEGLADFFGPSEHVDDKKNEGMRIRPNPWRLGLVKRMIDTNAVIPFEKLMTMTQAQMYARDVAGKAYAQSWSIIYFLAQADDRKHFDYLKDYFQALRKGKDLKQAYESVFGKADMAAMEARWREYMKTVN
jgi:tetratricopeptide (TPR) repeat protein